MLKLFKLLMILLLVTLVVLGYGYFNLKRSVDGQIELLAGDVYIGYSYLWVDPKTAELVLEKMRFGESAEADFVGVDRLRLAGFTLSQLLLGEGIPKGLKLTARGINLHASAALFEKLQMLVPGERCAVQGSWQDLDTGGDVFLRGDLSASLLPTDIYGEYRLSTALDVAGNSETDGEVILKVAIDNLGDLRLDLPLEVKEGYWRYRRDEQAHADWLDHCASIYGWNREVFISKLSALRPNWVVGNLVIAPSSAAVFTHWLEQPRELVFNLGKVRHSWRELLGFGGNLSLLDGSELTLSIDDNDVPLFRARSYAVQQAKTEREKKLADVVAPVIGAPVVGASSAKVLQSQPEAQQKAVHTRNVYREKPWAQLSSYRGEALRVYLRGRSTPHEGLLDSVSGDSLVVLQRFERGDFKVTLARRDVARVEVLVTEEFTRDY